MWLPFVALLFVQFFFGGLPVASKLVLLHLSPPAVVLLRSVFAAVVFHLFNVATARSASTGTSHEISSDLSNREKWKSFRAVAFLALIGISLNQMTLFYALRHTTAIAAALIVPFISIFTLGFSVLLRREKFHWISLASVVLGVAGVLFLILPKLRDTNPADGQELFGNLLCVLSAAFYALFLVLSKSTVHRLGTQRFSAQLFAAGSIWNGLFFAVLFFSGQSGVWSEAHLAGSNSLPVEFWFGLGFVLLCSTVLAYFLNSWALKKLHASTVGGFVCLQTLIGVGLASVFLHEKITSAYGIGGSLILASVVLLSVKQARSARRFSSFVDLPDS